METSSVFDTFWFHNNVCRSGVSSSPPGVNKRFTCTVSVQQRPPVARDALCVVMSERKRVTPVLFGVLILPLLHSEDPGDQCAEEERGGVPHLADRGEKSHQSPKTTDTERRKSRFRIRTRWAGGTHGPDRRGEAKHGGLHSVGDEGNDVFPQTSVSVQSPEDVECVDLQR